MRVQFEVKTSKVGFVAFKGHFFSVTCYSYVKEMNTFGFDFVISSALPTFKKHHSLRDLKDAPRNAELFLGQKKN